MPIGPIAAGLIGTLSSSFGQSIGRNQQNRQYQKNWRLQNEYNTPKNQMKRLREAGLNPKLIYGNAAAGGQAQQIQAAGSSADYKVDPVGQISQYASAENTQANTGLIKTQENKMNAERLKSLAEATRTMQDVSNTAETHPLNKEIMQATGAATRQNTKIQSEQHILNMARDGATIREIYTNIANKSIENEIKKLQLSGQKADYQSVRKKVQSELKILQNAQRTSSKDLKHYENTGINPHATTQQAIRQIGSKLSENSIIRKYILNQDQIEKYGNNVKDQFKKSYNNSTIGKTIKYFKSKTK